MPDFRFAIAGERFAQRYPKEITVSDLDVTYSLWPASTNQILDLRQFDEEELRDDRNPATTLTGHPTGVAITEQIWLDFSADTEGEDLKAQAESTLILKAKPSHYVESGAFGPLSQRDAGLFPEYEGATDIALQWLMRSPAVFKWSGLLNDGGALANYSRPTTHNTSSASSTWKCRGDSGWHLDANDESWQILLHWLRTGNDDYFQFFKRLSAHSANAGTIHLETENSIQVNSNGLPAAGASRRPGAAPWGQPFSGAAHGARSRIFWYLLSGDLRSLDLFADNLRFMLAARNPSPLNVTEMTLGYEILDAISRNSRPFVTRRLERLQRLKKRATADNWKQCAAAASNYLALERDFFSNPTRILDRAMEAVHSSRPGMMDPSARSQFAEGLLHFAMAHAEDSAERKSAHESILRIAEIEMEVAGEAAFSGKAVAFAHAIQPKAAYVSWTKKQLTEMFDGERMDLLSLKHTPVSRLSYQELWRRLSLHPNLSAHQTSQLYGRLIGRVPWFLQVIEAAAKLEKLKSVKTRLAVTATALSEGVRIAWKGQIGWDATGFELHRRKGDEGKFSVIETFPGRKDSDSYFDNKIERGRSYQYLLHVRNRDGKVTPYGEPLTVTPLTWVRRINCGGPDVTTPDGRVWEADKTRISGSGIWTSRSSIQKAAVLQEIYKSERWAKTS
ncbi:MAG: malectin domain-containing carbohydrate-binding protein, partial [Planctomycetota bacterium]|nr:malectin domain-containing carbohydrate-binding protein [Planctomycetota bacterium]